MSAEDFHSALQEATNFPLRGFVLPYLKHTLPSLQRDLNAAARINNQVIYNFFQLLFIFFFTLTLYLFYLFLFLIWFSFPIFIFISIFCLIFIFTFNFNFRTNYICKGKKISRAVKNWPVFFSKNFLSLAQKEIQTS